MTSWPDLINGLFELGGAAILTLNVRQLLRDKTVRGIHWSPTVFFTSWGIWNLYYYTGLDQWFSFAGGIAIVCVNAVWLGLTAVYWPRGGDDGTTNGVHQQEGGPAKPAGA